MSSEISQEDFERFQEIREEMEVLLNEAFQIVPDGHQKERARAYWYNIILGNLDSTWREGGSMCTMLDTENELVVIEEDEDEEDEDDDIEDYDDEYTREDDEEVVENTDNNQGLDG